MYVYIYIYRRACIFIWYYDILYPPVLTDGNGQFLSKAVLMGRNFIKGGVSNMIFDYRKVDRGYCGIWLICADLVLWLLQIVRNEVDRWNHVESGPIFQYGSFFLLSLSLSLPPSLTHSKYALKCADAFVCICPTRVAGSLWSQARYKLVFFWFHL